MPIGMTMMRQFTPPGTWVTATATKGTWQRWVIVRSNPVGDFIVEQLKGENENEPVNSKEFLSFHTYYYIWKKSFPKLKVTKYSNDKERLESLALDPIDKGKGKV